MTREEAKEQMRLGNKVTHEYFSPDEWISEKDGKVLTEEGYLHNTTMFWNYKTAVSFDNGWELFLTKD
jgi:hypothetical protein